MIEEVWGTKFEGSSGLWSTWWGNPMMYTALHLPDSGFRCEPISLDAPPGTYYSQWKVKGSFDLSSDFAKHAICLGAMDIFGAENLVWFADVAADTGTGRYTQYLYSPTNPTSYNFGQLAQKYHGSNWGSGAAAWDTITLSYGSGSSGGRLVTTFSGTIIGTRGASYPVSAYHTLVVPGTVYTPTTGIIGIAGWRQDVNQNCHVVETHMPVTGTALGTDQFAFYGSSKAWTGIGYYPFDDTDILSISPITQTIGVPGEEGVWESEVTVRLKNTDNTWGTLWGTAPEDTPVGYFIIQRQMLVSGAVAPVDNPVEQMFWGDLVDNGFGLDAQSDIVELRLKSPAIIDYDYWGTSRFVGTVGSTPGAGGTWFRIDRNEAVKASFYKYDRMFNNDVSWGDVGTVTSPYAEIASDSLVLSTGGAAPWYATLTLNGTVPDWATAVGGSVYSSQSLFWGKSWEIGNNLPPKLIESFNRQHGGPEINFELDGPVPLSMTKPVYAGDNMGDVLRDFTSGLGGCAGFLGKTLVITPFSALAQLPDGTLAWGSVVEKFDLKYTQPMKYASVKCDFDIDEAKLQTNIYMTNPEGIGGHSVSSSFLDTASGSIFAQRLLDYYGSVSSTWVVKLEENMWARVYPGDVLNIEDVPSTAQTTGSKFVVQSRTFSYESRMVEAVLLESSLADFFILDTDVVGTATPGLW